MARSVTAAPHNSAHNGVNGNQDLQHGGQPPSTLAAQIVQNHEQAAQQRTDGERATFGQLLQEILNNTSSEETDLEVNYKLVRVVTEAGLDVFLQDDPFARRSLLVDQARDSISVIELTIQRTPALLLYPNRRDEGSHQPLFFWILPRVFALLGNPKADGLQSILQRLLSCIITSLMRTGHLWQTAISFLNLYKSCADGTFRSLDMSLK